MACQKSSSGSAAVAATVLLVLAGAGVVRAVPLRAANAVDAGTSSSSSSRPLAHYFHANSCPQLETIVRAAVDAAVRQNVRLTAGLLRIMFHDCFPNGCDGSILLDNGERLLGPNVGLQQAALQLIEDVRAKVHAACGATVSCADITVLATRDAVNIAGGPSFSPPLGRLDSLAPAADNDVFTLPPPSFTVDELLTAFNAKGLSDPADLVALSGAHTVGKSRCGNFPNQTAPAADDLISRCVLAQCPPGGDANRLRDFDFLTPEVFDNLYFVDLVLNKPAGVMMLSDQGLATHPRTNWLVKGFADNHWWFFDQFSTSMVKMSQLKGPQGNVGEIRRNCFRPNSRTRSSQQQGLAASA